MAITRGVRAAIGVFGYLLQAGIRDGLSQRSMFDAYRAAYAQLGQPAPPISGAEMSTFRGGLGRFTRSMAALSRASDTDALTSEHWAQPIGYTPNAADEAVPSLLVYYQSQVDTEAGPVMLWNTVSYHSNLPTTVGEIRADAITMAQQRLDQAAMEEGNDSPTAGGTVTGLGQMYLVGTGL